MLANRGCYPITAQITELIVNVSSVDTESMPPPEERHATGPTPVRRSGSWPPKLDAYIAARYLLLDSIGAISSSLDLRTDDVRKRLRSLGLTLPRRNTARLDFNSEGALKELLEGQYDLASDQVDIDILLEHFPSLSTCFYQDGRELLPNDASELLRIFLLGRNSATTDSLKLIVELCDDFAWHKEGFLAGRELGDLAAMLRHLTKLADESAFWTIVKEKLFHASFPEIKNELALLLETLFDGIGKTTTQDVQLSDVTSIHNRIISAHPAYDPSRLLDSNLSAFLELKPDILFSNASHGDGVARALLVSLESLARLYSETTHLSLYQREPWKDDSQFFARTIESLSNSLPFDAEDAALINYKLSHLRS